MGTSGLGTLLVEDGLLTEADRRTIKRTCGGQGSAFARGVLALGLLDEDELAAFLAEKTRWKVAPKGLFKQSKEAVWGIIDRPLIERLEVLPLYAEGHVLHVAMVDPLDQDTLHQLAFFTGYKIAPVISTMSEIRTGLQKLLANYRPIKSQLEDFLENHAGSASRRSRLTAAASRSPKKKRSTARLFAGDEDVSPADPSGRGEPPPARWASPVPPPASPVLGGRAEQGVAPVAAAAAGAGMAATLAGSGDLDFQADDDLFREDGATKPVVDADLGGLDDFEAADSTAEAAGSKGIAAADESLDGLGDDIDNLGLEGVGDDLFGEDKPAASAAAEPSVPAAKPKAKAPPLDFGADEGEDDVDLSAFDPDAEPALDDLDLDLSSMGDDIPAKPADKIPGKQDGIVAGSSAAPFAGDLASADELGEDLGDGLDGGLSGDLGLASAAELGDELGDLGGDLGAATTDELGDELGDLGAAATDELGDELGDLGAAATDELGDELGDLGAAATDELGDELGDLGAAATDELGDELGDLGGDLGAAATDEPAGDLSASAIDNDPEAVATAVGGADPLLAPPSAADDSAREANAKRNRELLRKLAGRKIAGA